jgi:hypothetical protein
MITTNKKSFIHIKPGFVVTSLSLLLLILFTNISAGTEYLENHGTQDSNSSPVRRKSIEKIKLISFNLISGQRFSGKLVNENPFEIEIAEIKGSKILLSKYYKNDIDKKSIIYKTVSELDYFRDTGNYFLEKVWDFEDDPDEFIQAIRCYEKAKSLVETAVGPEHKLAAELDEKISQIKADMEKWAQQTKERAELRELELLSTLDSHLQQIQEQIATNSKDIANIQRELVNNTAAIGDYKELGNQITSIEVATRLLEQRILEIEDDIRDLWRRYRPHPPYLMSPKSKNEPNSQPKLHPQ